MAHVEFNVESGEVCSGNQGYYMGNLYHTAGPQQKLTLTRTKLGTFNAAFNNPVTMIHAARNAAERAVGYEIPPDRIAALGLMRLCYRRRHIDAEIAVGQIPSLERVASLAVAHTLDDVEGIKPRQEGKERDRFQFDHNGIGSAERVEPGMTHIRNLIHLPTSPVELRDPAYRISRAIRTSARGGSMTDKPYVAQHGFDGQSLELTVLLDELQ